MNEKYKNALFLSDLDGTLLDRDAKIPAEAAEHLRRLHEAGVKVTFATARTIATVKHILKDVPCPLPVALMNGVLLYSFAENRYVSVSAFPLPCFSEAAERIRREGLSPFYYFLDGGNLVTCYEKVSCPAMENFMRERQVKYGKQFTRVTWDEITEVLAGASAGIFSGSSSDISPDISRKIPDKAVSTPLTPIYFCVIGPENAVTAAASRCREIPGVRVECYPDPHADVWYMEIFSASASKRSATRALRRLAGCDRIVAFGDNFNDLPMFEEADEAYAVSTAPEEVRRVADSTVARPEECGVTMKIASLTGVML